MAAYSFSNSFCNSLSNNLGVAAPIGLASTLLTSLTPLTAAEYTLSNGVTIVTDESDAAFHGITTITRDGVSLSNDATRMVPLVCWEWGERPWVADRMGPATVQATADTLSISAPLLAS
jgi:hypothetical protein